MKSFNDHNARLQYAKTFRSPKLVNSCMGVAFWLSNLNKVECLKESALGLFSKIHDKVVLFYFINLHPRVGAKIIYSFNHGTLCQLAVSSCI